jgi:hypothetical protein
MNKFMLGAFAVSISIISCKTSQQSDLQNSTNSVFNRDCIADGFETYILKSNWMRENKIENGTTTFGNLVVLYPGTDVGSRCGFPEVPNQVILKKRLQFADGSSFACDATRMIFSLPGITRTDPSNMYLSLKVENYKGVAKYFSGKTLLKSDDACIRIDPTQDNLSIDAKIFVGQ